VYSVNTVAARVLAEIGIPATIDMARRLGIKSEIPAVPSIALGSAELSLLELTSTYSVFANGGFFREPVCILRIEDHTGSVLYAHETPQMQAPVLADTVVQQLMHALQMVVDSGTAKSLRSQFGLSLPLAGKTGTTQRYADGWFVGVSPGLVTGVWVGADDPRVHFRTGAGAGGQTALPVFGAFLLGLENDASSRRALNIGPFPAVQNSVPECPLYSDLVASKAQSAHDSGSDDGDWLSALLGSLFGDERTDPKHAEQKLQRQLQKKLDRTVVRMQKRKKSPHEISRALEEIREDYRRRIKAVQAAESHD